jgi:hypothetical protein
MLFRRSLQFAAILVAFTGLALPASAVAVVPYDAATSAANTASFAYIQELNSEPGYNNHASESAAYYNRGPAPKGKSWMVTQKWHLANDNTGKPAGSCTLKFKLSGSSRKVKIAKRWGVNNPCWSSHTKFVYYPLSGALVPIE